MHGLPLARRDVRRAFRAFVKAGCHIAGDDVLGPVYKSYREIAAELGGTRRHTTIYNWMREDFPRLARAMGSDKATGNSDAGPPEGTYMGEGAEDAMTALDMVRDLRSLVATIADPRWRGEVIDAL